MPQSSICKGVATAILNNQYELCVIYHNTMVLRLTKRDNIIELDNGGWITATTVLRMNQAARQYKLGFSVGRKKGVMSYSLWGNMDKSIPFDNNRTASFKMPKY